MLRRLSIPLLDCRPCLARLSRPWSRPILGWRRMCNQCSSLAVPPQTACTLWPRHSSLASPFLPPKKTGRSGITATDSEGAVPSLCTPRPLRLRAKTGPTGGTINKATANSTTVGRGEDHTEAGTHTIAPESVDPIAGAGAEEVSVAGMAVEDTRIGPSLAEADTRVMASNGNRRTHLRPRLNLRSMGTIRRRP